MGDKKKKIITHDGNFHADEVFAVATLLIFDENTEVIRTRDPKIIQTGDYVVDVGGVYDEDDNRFDHHQSEGAGGRDDGIPYSSFGLVWKRFGSEVSGSTEIAEYIDKDLVMPIDANDCGIAFSSPKKEGTYEYSISRVMGTFMPVDESRDTMAGFLDAVSFAKKVLLYEIKRKKNEIDAAGKIKDIYSNTGDKRILVFDTRLPWENEVMKKYPDVLFVIYPYGSQWRVKTVRKDWFSFKTRKDLPREWGGKTEKELEKITGVQGALFCHRSLFTAGTGSKDGAMALAKLAVDN